MDKSTKTIPRLLCLLLATSIWGPLQTVAKAGVGPENVVVVVNEASLASRTLANHYVQLRRIPHGNVIHLKEVPSELEISLADFKEQILSPLLQELDRRKISAQTKVVAYSADFPTTIKISEHTDKLEDENQKKFQRPRASITGATFFYRLILADNPLYLSWQSNLYARGPIERFFANPFRGEEKAQFDSAKAKFDNQEFVEAAEGFEKLSLDAPSIPSLSVMAADAFARSDETEKAIGALRTAIRNGWYSKSYLQENEALAPLLENPGLAKLMPYLSSAPTSFQPPVGFNSNVGWDVAGNPRPVTKGGVPYLMSCMLGVIHENGSTLEQAIQVLERASTADLTYPKAEFQFCGSQDVRAKTRMPGVPDAMVYLQNNDFVAEIFPSVLPQKKAKIAGMMLGRSRIELNNVPWKLVPGAIVDNLTSYGGVFRSENQIKLTEFLHAGAAMSSGTVDEPYAIQQKFPLPALYAFYADGVSAVEAFYLTVSSPYQLLIVGDPLTCPYGRPPSDLIDISLKENGQVLFNRRGLGLDVPSSPLRHIEMFVGERLIQVTNPLRQINLNLPDGAVGVWDVRVSLVGFDSTAPRSSFVEPLVLGDPKLVPKAEIIKGRKQMDDQMIRFRLKCAGAKSIDLLHYNQVVGSVAGESGTISVETRLLGDGPLPFRPVANVDGKTILGFTLVDPPASE